MHTVDFMEKLQAKEAIRELLIAFAHAQDSKRFEQMRVLVTQDVEADYLANGVIVGQEQLIDIQRRFLGDVGRTQHLLGNFRINVAGETATSSCYVRAMHSSNGPEGERIVDLWGEYHDTLMLTAEGWRIRRRVHDFHNSADILALTGQE